MSRNILLLDVDGVLVTPPEMFGARLMRLYPETARELFSGPFLAASTGRLDLQHILPTYLAELNYPGTPEQFMAEWFQHEHHPNLPMLHAVRGLKAAGWAVALATNQERHRLRYLLHDMALNTVLNGEYASCTVGHRKPSPLYFSEVTARLQAQHPGLSPAGVVFWDDVHENVAAARAAGWVAHVYTDVAGFRRVMAEFA